MAKADSNFTLDEFINSGLYGVVWKATQARPKRTVAVKIVNPEHGMTFNAAEHAHGLVKAGPHPNIVDVYQVTKVKHPEEKKVVDAVIMEWLDGDSLGARLAKSPLLDADDARGVCDGVLSGIAHLHANGVTHSDLHVGNIILTAQGPRIIDIDYSSAQSLARLTTLDRKFRIQADVSQVAHMVGMIIRRTMISQDFYDRNGESLRNATKLDEVVQFVKDAFGQVPVGLRQMTAPVVEPVPAANKGTSNLFDDVEVAIEQSRWVTLRRLIMDSANSIAAELAEDKYSAKGNYDKEQLRERVANYKTTVGPLIPALSSMGYWGGARVDALTVEAIDRLANAHEKERGESGLVAYLALRRYPVVTALYAAGIGAVAGDNYEGMLHILRDTVFYRYGVTKEKLWTELAYSNAEQRDVWNEILGRDMYFPVSQILELDLREPLAGTIPSDIRYIEKFDRFEFFASLDHFLFHRHAIGMNFFWRRREIRNADLLPEIKNEALAAGPKWAPLQAGLLNGTDRKNVIEVLDEFGVAIEETRKAYRMW
jgi:hypothetical protein